MLTSEQKKKYFDKYWEDQPSDKTDPRSKQRSEYVWNMLESTDGSLLDVGCGRGIMLEYFASHGFDVTGIDISPESVRIAEKMGYNAAVVDLEADEIKGQFDIILCLEVLQQVYDPVSILKKLTDALTDNGELIVSLPNEFHIVSRLKLLLGNSHLGHFDHSHVRLFSLSRHRELFGDAGLRIIKSKHVSIVPPSYDILSNLFNPLLNISPSLMSLSSIYKLEKK